VSHPILRIKETALSAMYIWIFVLCCAALSILGGVVLADDTTDVRVWDSGRKVEKVAVPHQKLKHWLHFVADM
jgi:hypothetical protein